MKPQLSLLSSKDELWKRKTIFFPIGKNIMKLHLWVLLLAELSAICALGIHLVSSTTVRA